jgi:hypothetical protein
MRQRTSTSDFLPLGDKWVSLPNLKKNKVCLRLIREEIVRQCNIPSSVVSNDVRNILLDYVLNKRWMIKEYDQLGERDKDELNKVLYNCGLDFELGIQHHFNNYESDVSRFEELKSLIDSSDNLVPLFREMRLILLRLIAGGRIPRSKAFNLLYDLAVVSEY